MWWWLACQQAPPEPSFSRPTAPGDVVGWITVEHFLSRGEDPRFEVLAGFLDQPWTGLAWSEPLEGLGDCGTLPGYVFPEREHDPLSAGTIFFDSGQELPWALPPLDGEYTSGQFDGTWGADMAVTAVGEDLPAFDWEPALRLPAEPLQIEAPAENDALIPGDLEVRWAGQDHSFVQVVVRGVGADTVVCEEPDDGHLRVPDSLFGSVTDRITLSLSRVSLWWHELEPGRFVEIEVKATDQRSLSVEEQ
jgi:hypothetical protein